MDVSPAAMVNATVQMQQAQSIQQGQIAVFTFRINHLTQHLKTNKKDYNTQRSLIRLVGKRRSQLDYLKNKDIERYREIIKKLKIRR